MAENTQTLPVVALRGLVVFPSMAIHFDIGREASIAAVEHAAENNKEIFLVAQKDVNRQNPEMDDLERIGTISRVRQIMRLSDTSVRVMVEGVERAQMQSLATNGPFLQAEVVPFAPDDQAPSVEHMMLGSAYARKASELFERLAISTGRVSSDILASIAEIHDPGQLADVIAASVLEAEEDRQTVLNCIDDIERLKTVVDLLERELELQALNVKISESVRRQLDQHQKEFFLRAQMKAIQNELGEGGDEIEDDAKLRERIREANLPEEVLEAANRELGRMNKMAPSAPEWSIIHSYLDTILALPWGKMTEDNLDLKHARGILDEDHYGLEKVKDRIIEFLAVRRLKQDAKGPILCLAGPPGVGKTSIAKSIARALGKEFARMSLGGVRDEAEIRGHRRTYIGAMPGRILTSIQRAGTMNPVFLLDEIDKMGNDYRGDPSSAMLEVLDPELNTAFRDHYLDLDFDLSNVFFITTANDVDSIPAPLYDRMEIIRVDSYTDVEKMNIARRHLLAKQEKEHGLPKGTVRISDAVLMEVIHKYTSESGVRELERQIAAVMRKAAARVVEDGVKTVTVSKRNLKDYLGLPKHSESGRLRKDAVGVVNGLAWTAVGGTTLSVEVSVIPGTGKLELTGQLGDVMKESAKTAISVVRGMSDRLRFPADQNERTDLHIHVPEGAVPKDGPSAGVTMVTAIASALTGRPVRHQIAMTGEITLTGRVLKIGGVKEKMLAAHRAGIRTVILPKDNKNDLEEVPASVKDGMEFIFAGTAEDVLRHALAERSVAG